MSKKWKRINSKIVYGTPWFKIREDQVIKPDGKQGIYAYLEKPASNFIIALDKNKNVYLIEEYRYPLGENILQLPAGMVETENVLKEAKRELYEETGIKAKRWVKLGSFYIAPGHETTYVNVFLATELDLSDLRRENQDGNEAILEVVKVQLPELREMVINGKIQCGITVAALNLFFIGKSDE